MLFHCNSDRGRAEKGEVAVSDVVVVALAVVEAVAVALT